MIPGYRRRIRSRGPRLLDLVESVGVVGRAEALTRAGTGTRARARAVAGTRVGPGLEPLPGPAWGLGSSRCRDPRGTRVRAVAGGCEPCSQSHSARCLKP